MIHAKPLQTPPAIGLVAQSAQGGPAQDFEPALGRRDGVACR